MRQRRKMCVHVHAHVVDLLVGAHRKGGERGERCVHVHVVDLSVINYCLS